MKINPSFRLLLAAQVIGATLSAVGPEEGKGAAAPESPLLKVDFQGGSADDVAFARVAAALRDGLPVSDPSFQVALAAIRRTDRFRSVEGTLIREKEGIRARVRLDPWPPLRSLVLDGVSRAQMKGLAQDLHVGVPVGELQLTAWRMHLQEHLVEVGYPMAQVRCERSQDGQALRAVVSLGQAARVEKVVFEGNPAPYTLESLLKTAKVVPGKTLWTPMVRMDVLSRLRKRFLKDKRYEGNVSLDWQDGLLRITVEPGPVVRLRREADPLGLGWTVGLKDILPISRASSYSPEILDEGERVLVRALRGKGYLDAQVGHRREVLRSGPGGPEEVLVTYTLHRGPRSPINGVHFEGNQDIREAELIKAADLPSRLLSPLHGVLATPDLVDGIAGRVKALYLSRGYTEATVRLQPLQRKDGRTELLFKVSEGPQRLVKWLQLDLPRGGFGDPWGLGECLTAILSDRPMPLPGPPPLRRYVTDQKSLSGLQGELACREAPGGGMVLTLTLSRPIPLIMNDLMKVYNMLRQQRLAALGVVRPVVRLTLDEAMGQTGVHLAVPEQPVEKVDRLIVQGSERTRAKAVLRETDFKPGAPYDLSNLSRSQANLGFLGAFQRVDFSSLAEAPPDQEPEAAKEGPPVPWKQGDLLLHLEERSPWQVTSSFGYDSSQGYHIGTGIQRINVGGMGRTVDFGIRAGDGTIDNPTLRKWFPTGPNNRSVDSFTLGYTDPWFDPVSWLPDRTQLSMEGAYIEERRSLYLLHRRRFLSSLQWLITPQVSFQVGYRFERVDVSPGVEGISAFDLETYARYPPKAIISAPYLQLARDTRDNPLDPTSGSYSVARLEMANQLFLTDPKNSFVKLDLRQQWTWPVGTKARAGVVALGLRLGMARPTASTAEDLPLSERFFGGGPFSQRGVEPDELGPTTQVPNMVLQPTPTNPNNWVKDGTTQLTSLGGQGLALVNLEYRFPLVGKSVWGEVFVDSGQVYEYILKPRSADANGTVPPFQFPPFRTSVGLGLIVKVSIPIKLEYAADLDRILGRPRPQEQVDTQLRGLSISAGFQF